MSGTGMDWAPLASEYERLVAGDGDGPEPRRSSSAQSQPAQWAELASQRERLIESGDRAPRLASSDCGTASFRLAVPAA